VSRVILLNLDKMVDYLIKEGYTEKDMEYWPEDLLEAIDLGYKYGVEGQIILSSLTDKILIGIKNKLRMQKEKAK